MSAEATFWAWDQQLKHTTKIVLLALADYNSPRNECYPSSESLAKKTGMSKRQILREIEALVEGGFLLVTKSQGRSNRYHLNIQSGDTQSPVTNSHQCHTVTTPVTHSHQSGDTQSPEPKKNLKPNLKIYRKLKLGNLPVSVSHEAAKEFIDHRINLKKPLTQQAFDRAMKQADGWQQELNLSTNEIILLVIDCGWQWAQLDWLKKRLNGDDNAKPNTSAREQRLAGVAEATYGKTANQF